MAQTTTFNMLELWQQNDGLQQGVAILLLVMSLVSWTVIVLKSWQFFWISRQQKAAQHFTNTSAFDVNELPKKLQATPYQFVIDSGLAANLRHQNMTQVPQDQWVLAQLRAAIEMVQEQLQSRLSFLATIGATAPFVGLFGTVYGIYKALMTMAANGKADIAQVSGPIGEALIMTGAGLIVAIPAVVFFNMFNRLTKKSTNHIKRFTQLVYPYFLADCKPTGIKS